MEVVARRANGRDSVELWKTHSSRRVAARLRMPMLNGVGKSSKSFRDLDVPQQRRDRTLPRNDTDEEILYQAIMAGGRVIIKRCAF